MQGMNMHIVPFASGIPLIGWFGIHALPVAHLLESLYKWFNSPA